MHREDPLLTPATALDPGMKLDWNAFTALAKKRMEKMEEIFIVQVVDVCCRDDRVLVLASAEDNRRS